MSAQPFFYIAEDRATSRLMPPTDLRPNLRRLMPERLIFGPMLHAFDRPFFLLIARGVNRRCNRLQIDQICGRMMPEVRR